MENKDSRRNLSVQIAMASVGNDIKHEKVKIEMIKDGFQLIWGVRKASEWVLDIKSEKKRQRYSRYLMSRWTQRSQGFLVESDGQPATLPRLRESMKQNADKLQEIVKNLLGEIPSTDVKNPRGKADYAKLKTELMVSVGKAISQVEEISLQIVAVMNIDVPTVVPSPFVAPVHIYTDSHYTYHSTHTSGPVWNSPHFTTAAEAPMAHQAEIITLSDTLPQLTLCKGSVRKDTGQSEQTKESLTKRKEQTQHIAAVQDVPSHNSYQQRRQDAPTHSNCHRCGKSGHWSRHCRNRQRNTEKPVSSQQRGMDSDTTSEILNLLRSLAKI